MAPTLNEVELLALATAGQQGNRVRLHGPQQLRSFAEYIAAQQEVIRNVETYEVQDELELPRIDLGLYQGSSEEADRLATVRLAASELELDEILACTAEDGRTYVFDVWTDENK